MRKALRKAMTMGNIYLRMYHMMKQRTLGIFTIKSIILKKSNFRSIVSHKEKKIKKKRKEKSHDTSISKEKIIDQKNHSHPKKPKKRIRETEQKISNHLMTMNRV